MEGLSLSLTLQPDRPRVSKDDLPRAIVRLANTGKEAILVNTRMLLAPGGSPAYIREMTFLISGPPGAFSLMTFSIRAGLADVDQFRMLAPGTYIERVYDLKQYFYYDNVGLYRIQAVYHQETDPEGLGGVSWKGDLPSNEANFEIV